MRAAYPRPRPPLLDRAPLLSPRRAKRNPAATASRNRRRERRQRVANQSGRRKSPPSQRPSQSPGDEGASSTASVPGSDSDPLVGDAGPAFDPDSPPAPEQPPLAAAEILEGLPEWEEEVIGNLLGLKGRVLHALAGVAAEDWLYTELDLAAIVPPLVRILNRYEPPRRYAGHADPIMVAFGVGGYGLRSVIERQQALAAEEPPQTEMP